MDRVVVWHRTAPARLPAIEREGLRTRVDLGPSLGQLDAFDAAATGRFARGRRVSGWLERAAADADAAVRGTGLVSFTVDPHRAVAVPAAARVADPAGAWGSARPLAEWLAEPARPADLEVHSDQPVRAGRLRIHGLSAAEDGLGSYAPLVAAVADTDRVAAKLLVHVLLAAADGSPDDPAFLAACALAWREQEDPAGLERDVARADLEAVVEAVLAVHAGTAPEAVAALRAVIDGLRADADGDATLESVIGSRSARTLERVAAAVAGGRDGVRG